LPGYRNRLAGPIRCQKIAIVVASRYVKNQTYWCQQFMYSASDNQW